MNTIKENLTEQKQNAYIFLVDSLEMYNLQVMIQTDLKLYMKCNEQSDTYN